MSTVKYSADGEWYQYGNSGARATSRSLQVRHFLLCTAGACKEPALLSLGGRGLVRLVRDPPRHYEYKRRAGSLGDGVYSVVVV